MLNFVFGKKFTLIDVMLTWFYAGFLINEYKLFTFFGIVLLCESVNVLITMIIQEEFLDEKI